MKSTYKKVKNKLKGHDLFGHTIALNFKGGGDTHPTTLGGFFSIFIKISITLYIAINFLKLILYKGDTINLTIKKLNLDEVEALKYDGTNQLLFWSLKDTSKGNRPVYLDDPRLKPNKSKKIRPYLNISFI